MLINKEKRSERPSRGSGLLSRCCYPSGSGQQVDETYRRSHTIGNSNPGIAKTKEDSASGRSINAPSVPSRRLADPGIHSLVRLPLQRASSDSRTSINRSTDSQNEQSGPKKPLRFKEALGSKETHQSKESPSFEEGHRPEEPPRSIDPSRSKQPSRSKEALGFKEGPEPEGAPEAKESPRSNNTSDVDRINTKPNAVSGATTCWETATLRLQYARENKFKVLLSASKKGSLEKEEFLKCLGTSGKQEESKKLHVHLERLWQALQPFQHLAMIAARADSHMIAPYAVGSLFLLIRISLGLEYRDFIIEIFSDITCMMMRWYHFSRRLENLRDPTLIKIKVNTRSLKDHLTDLFFQVLDLAASIHIYLGNNGVQRLGKRMTAKKVEWQDMLRSLKETESWCKACKELIDAESKFQKDNASILAWITLTDQKRDHELQREKHGVDTIYSTCGQWLFETFEYRGWKEAQDASKSVLWLKGTVGTGKTTLMCRAIDELREDLGCETRSEHRVIHYYCTGSKPGETRSDCNLCLRALIRQLAIDLDNLSVAASVQAEYDNRKMDDPSDCRFSGKECERLLKELIPDNPRKMRTTIIIDALDECEDGGYELLNYLKSILSSRPQSVRLLLSSQMHVRVAPYFSGNEIQTIEINPTRTNDDMQTFIKKEIGKQRVQKGILDSDQALRGQVVKELSIRATGMFQWVKLRLGLFFPTPPLESPEKVKQELQLLRMANPKNLNEAYKRLYMNTVTQNERENTAKTYRIILSAYEPLTIKEVVEAVSIGRDGEIHNHINAEYIRTRCHNFIVENEDGFLQFAHLSAKLFLERPENHGDKEFTDVDDFSDTANHREMAKVCLQLILRPDHPMWLIGKLESVRLKGEFGYLNMLAKIEGRQNRAIFREWAARRGFSQYAFSYWAKHCRKLGSTLSLGQELSRELNNCIFAPKMAFSWWFRLARGLKLGEWVFYLDTNWYKPAEENNTVFRFQQLSDLHYEVSHCLPNASSESKYLSPNPLLAICVWNLAECLGQPQVRDFLERQKWPSIPQSPLHVCCWSGSSQTLSNLIQHYPEKVWELMFKASERGHLPIEVAVVTREVNMTRSLLNLERARTRDRGCWSSRQLSSLGSLDIMMGSFPDEDENIGGVTIHGDTIQIMRLLLQFEADQSGAHFPQWQGEHWISELAQRSKHGGSTPLELAASFGDAKIVSLLLQAGAKPSTRSRVSSPLAEALSRADEEGSKIVEILLSKDPAVCDTVTDSDLISYLGRASSLEAANHILKKRPELARMRRRQDGKTALMIAHELQDLHQANALYTPRYQKLVEVLEEAKQGQDKPRRITSRLNDKHERSGSMKKG